MLNANILFLIISTSSQPSPIEEKENKDVSSPLRYESACEANDLKRIEVRLKKNI